MQSRSLGRSDLRLTELTLGTWGLAADSYGPVATERFDETVKSAIEKGIRAFDLAPLWGESEKRIAKLVKDAKIDAVLTTRAGQRLDEKKVVRAFTKESLIADCERSLAALEREQIDLWLLHNPREDELREREEEWKSAIETLEEDGKIRAWGASVGSHDVARFVIAAGAQAICLTHNLFNATMLDDLTADLAAAGCGVLARSPLQYGMLAGLWSNDRVFAKDDHRRERWSQLAFSERLRQIDDLRFLVGPQHRDLATASYRFVLNHSAVSSVVIGARSPYQVMAAVEAASGAPYLSDDDVARIAKVRSALL